MTKPIVKWVGGKTRLLDSLIARVPKTYGRYFEPFAGGAALFFKLAPERAVLNDMNEDLIDTYDRIAGPHLDTLIALLEWHRDFHDKEHYYATRDAWNRGIPDADGRAAAFIYLNKTCFNGLWRVNKSGAFNVPMGKYKNPKICDVDALRAASSLLKRATLRSGDFETAVADAVRGDFVYFDPPYHDTFTAYTEGDFGEVEQRRLAAVVRALAQRGVHVLLSNNDTPLIREIYEGFRIDEVQCSRPVNSDGAGRGAVTELLVSSP